MKKLIDCLIISCFVLIFSASVVSETVCFDVNKFEITPAGYGGGGRFTSIAVDPKDPQIVFIGSDVAGIFKSTDGGNTFNLKGRGLEGFAVADIAIHPTFSEQVILLTDEGLYISDDHGESWDKKSSSLKYSSRFCGSHVLVFSKKYLWVGTDSNGVFQITLDTPTSSIVPVPGLGKVKVNGLALHRGDIYAATSNGIFSYEKGAWLARNQGLNPEQHEIVDINSNQKDRMYIVEKTAGLYVWDDKQKQWDRRSPELLQTLINRPKAYKALAVNPDNADILFLATDPVIWPHYLFMSTNGGTSWRMVTDFSLAHNATDNWAKTINAIEEITFSPRNPQQIYMTDWWNVWKSMDGGHTWLQLHNGLQNTVVNDVKVYPEGSRNIFLSVSDNGLMVSANAGKDWKRKMSGVIDGHAQEREISQQHPLKMYLLINSWLKKDKIYIYKTLNGGETWEDISFPVPEQRLPQLGYVNGFATNLKIDFTTDDTVYVATNGYGIFKTTDGGTSWKAINHGLVTPYIKGPDALLIHPRNPHILFASTLQGGVYKTVDSGETWMPVSRNYPFTFGMAIDPSNPSRIFACAPEKKIVLSEDEGVTWKEIKLPGAAPPFIAANAIAIHPDNPQLVFVGTLAYNYKAADGLYISTDGGQTFKHVPFAVPRVNINKIAIHKINEMMVFICFNGIGVYQGEIKEVSNN